LSITAQAEVKKLLDDHRQELDDLEALRASEPPVIRKYSNGLLQLRRSEWAQLQSRNWRGAGEIKAIADDLQREEDEAQRQRRTAQIDTRVANARKAQAKQLRVRRDHWRNEELILVATANEQVQLAETAIAHMEENLRIAQRAMSLAADLKEETEVVAKQNGAQRLSRIWKEGGTAEGAEFRQRRILNAKIYTRLTRSELA
jgi:hypothetical protein